MTNVPSPGNWSARAATVPPRAPADLLPHYARPQLIPGTIAVHTQNDSEELVEAYWNGIGELIAIENYLAVSRRKVDPPFLLLFTDGITEAMAPPERGAARLLFDTDRLDALLVDFGNGGTEDCIDRIRAELSAFCENQPAMDDQTLIAIRRM